jgi:DNA invertase Pin-like site-specific DNA recombinase
VDKLFIEKASGKNTDRPQLREMLNYVREGDTVVVESYSRLARSTKDLLNIVDQLSEKNVNFISQKESFDTDTPQGKFILTVFAGLAELERETTLERQREGIAEAKKAGKYKGRKPIYIDKEKFKKVIEEWKAGNITAVEAQRRLKLKPSTFYRRVKDCEKERISQ